MADGTTPDLAGLGGAIERPQDLGTGPQAVVRFWQMQLKLAEKEDRDWIERGRRIVARYRDERDANEGRTAKYNILWANVEVLKPVLYGRRPKPDVQRRHKDESDPAATLGAEVLQRSLEWEDDVEELDEVLNQVVEDRLLPGRGVARVFYEYDEGEEEPDPAGGEDEEGQPQTFRPIVAERAPLRYVFFEDYRECPARTEREIWWKAYRSFLTREQLVDRFGRKIGNAVPLDYTPTGVTLEREGGPLGDAFKKATVWEIWNRQKLEAVWIAEAYNDGPLDEQPDPLELPGFYPSPPCLRATTNNKTRVPIADYVEYQDQAIELDNLTSRIDRLTRALKVAGVYAGSEKAVLQQLVDDGSENKLIPVEDWAGFAGDKGGLQGLIQWLPVEQIARVLLQLYDARERILRIIYQTTGLADILRGETNPTETLGAQQLKTQFATRRITKAQKDVARFARDLLRLRGCVMARHFSPDTLALMSGLPEPLPALPPPPPMLIPAPPAQFRQMQQLPPGGPPSPGGPPGGPPPPAALPPGAPGAPPMGGMGPPPGGPTPGAPVAPGGAVPGQPPGPAPVPRAA